MYMISYPEDEINVECQYQCQLNHMTYRKLHARIQDSNICLKVESHVLGVSGDVFGISAV